MKKTILTIVATIVASFMFTGCAITQVGVAKDMSAERTTRHEKTANATAAVVEKCLTAQQGGMSIGIGADGKVSSISYNERVDPEICKTALNNLKYKEEKVASLLQEIGDLGLKWANPISTIVNASYNHKNIREQSRANVAITQSNNELQGTMFESYTNNFQNTTNTSITDTTLTDTSTISTTDKTSISTTDSSNNVTSLSNPVE